MYNIYDGQYFRFLKNNRKNRGQDLKIYFFSVKRWQMS